MLGRCLSSLDHPLARTAIVVTQPDPIREEDLSEIGYLSSSGRYPHIVAFESEEINISKWWNTGLDYIKEHAQHRHEVLVLSSDIVGCSYSVAMLGAFLRRDNLAMVGPNLWGNIEQKFGKDSARGTHTRVAGCCWMVKGELGLRCDESFRWWYSDDDIEMQARQLGGTGILPYTLMVGGPDSYMSEEKAKWAVEDRQRFITKWGIAPW